MLYIGRRQSSNVDDCRGMSSGRKVAVGDDRIQMQSRGYVVPDSFTQVTSEQRMTWFKRGFTTGNVNNGDTFGEEI